MRVNGRARVDPSAPRAFAICDGCGGLYNHFMLTQQPIWAGARVIPTNKLVCRKCKDRLNPNLRSILIPPDPRPVIDPRPEFYEDYETDYRITEDGERRIIYPGEEPRIIDYGFPPNGVRKANANFDPVDPGEDEVFAFDFFSAIGNYPIESAVWGLETAEGADPSPTDRLLGSSIVSGAVVTHRMGGFVAGTTYRVTVTVTTSSGSSFTLWTMLPCNTLA